MHNYNASYTLNTHLKIVAVNTNIIIPAMISMNMWILFFFLYQAQLPHYIYELWEWIKVAFIK